MIPWCRSVDCPDWRTDLLLESAGRYWRAASPMSAKTTRNPTEQEAGGSIDARSRPPRPYATSLSKDDRLAAALVLVERFLDLSQHCRRWIARWAPRAAAGSSRCARSRGPGKPEPLGCWPSPRE
jgi:hypothetical protein